MTVANSYFQFMRTSAGVKLDGVTPGTVSASFNSEPHEITFSYGYSVSAVWTGAATGTFKLQASNDINASQTNPATASWVDVDGSEIALTAGSPIMWNIVDVNYRWFRFVYTRTAGDLTAITVSYTAKG